MPKPVIWSPLSENKLNNTHSYLQDQWDEKVVLAFLEGVESLRNQISKIQSNYLLQIKRRK